MPVTHIIEPSLKRHAGSNPVGYNTGDKRRHIEPRLVAQLDDA